MQSPESESSIAKYSEKQILILSGNYHPRIIMDGCPIVTNDLTCKFCEENYKSHGNLMRHLKNFHADEIVKIHEASLENKETIAAMEPTNRVERRATRSTNPKLIPSSLKSCRRRVTTTKSKRASRHNTRFAVHGPSTSNKADSKRSRESTSKYKTDKTKKLAPITTNSNSKAAGNSQLRMIAPAVAIPLAQNQDNNKLLNIFSKQANAEATGVISFSKNQDNTFQCVLCHRSFKTQIKAVQHIKQFHLKKLSAISTIASTSDKNPKTYLLREKLKPVWENKPEPVLKNNRVHKDSSTDDEDMHNVKIKNDYRRSGRISQMNRSIDGDCVIEYQSTKEKTKDIIKIEFDEHKNMKASDDISSSDFSTESKKDKDTMISKLLACPCCDDLFSTVNFTKKHLSNFHNLSPERQRNLKLKIQDKPLTSEFFRQLKNSKNNLPMKEAGRDPQRLTKIFVCPACDDLSIFENLNTTRDHMKTFHRLTIENQKKINLIIKSINI